MALTPGTLLGRYEVLAVLGKGGMGEVYRARDPQLQREVAIKVSTRPFNERFTREARAVAALNHPNVCQIYDVGPNFLVIELIEGPTLSERIKTGALAHAEVRHIADQIGDALFAAHERGIVHRDLKPANIKVREDGVVKVLDFGLARFSTPVAAGVSEEDSTESMSLTAVGSVVGTAAYMSPEQARGLPVDARTDIWAFGVVLYEMLVGHRPFRGQDVTEMLASVVKEAPELRAVPAEFRELVGACLHKDPKHRLQAIGDRHLLGAPVPASQNWLWPAVAAAVGLVAIALAWRGYGQEPSMAESFRYPLALSAERGFGFQISPDGRYLAYPAGPALRLHVRALDASVADADQEREFPGTDGTTYPFWSPDSRHIAFFAQKELRRLPLDGGPATKLADAPDARGGAWGPDGTIVFAPSPVGTFSRVSSAGGAATPISLPHPGANSRDSLRFPSFLDAERFLYTIETFPTSGQGVYVGTLAGGAPVRLLPELSAAAFVASTGTLLFRREGTLLAQPLDATRLQLAGEPRRVADDVPDSGNTANAAFTISSTGTLLYESRNRVGEEVEIVSVDRSGKDGKVFVKQAGINSFSLSPDGRQLAYSLATQRRSGDLYLHDVTRGTSQRFTFGPFSALLPVWSPTSDALIFTAYPEDRLYRKETRTTAKEVPLPATGTNTYAFSWSPSNTILYAQTGTATQSDLYMLTLGEDKPREVKRTAFSEGNGQLSPDGRWVAYESDASGKLEVYVEAVDGSAAARQVSASGGSRPRWRKDGLELYFVANQRLFAVATDAAVQNLGVAEELFRDAGLQASDQGQVVYEPVGDGRSFLVLRPVGDAPVASMMTLVTNWK